MNEKTTKMASKIGMAQLNPIVGAVRQNAEKLLKARADKQVELLVTSELFLAGYPPEDLVQKPSFVAHIRDVAMELVAKTSDGGTALLFGLPYVGDDDGKLYNAVMLADGGKYEVRYKHHLPNYGVFDEQRLFAAGVMPAPVAWRGIKLGLPICEDIWFPDVCAHLKAQGADLLISPNGSPFERGKHARRLHQAQARVQETGLAMIYVNQCGGQDELVFDGGSFVLDAQGAQVVQMPFWEAGVALSTMPADALAPPDIDGREQIYTAAMIGLRDYVEKSGFPHVVLGLSGGIDSALCAALAADALGAERVRAIMLPSRYTSAESLRDAAACAKALGIVLDEMPIIDAVAAVETTLAPIFSAAADTPADATAENIQSRLRGTLLMALSNKFGSMLVTTGNKSEMAVGYATLYGDMNGGYNPIKDIYKTEVFKLAEWRNAHMPTFSFLAEARDVIPQSIITKPPSAELRPDQTDQDSLPPYDVLDAILYALIEEEAHIDTIVSKGYERALVCHIENLLYRSEYKRRQAPPGLKISRRNFGRDRRYPLVNYFRDFKEDA